MDFSPMGPGPELAALRLGGQFGPLRADASDGRLDLCAFSQGSLWHGLRYMLAAHWGCHERLADCRTERVGWLRFTSEASRVPYQVDGDPGGQLPVDIKVLPARLTLLAPPVAPVV